MELIYQATHLKLKKINKLITGSIYPSIIFVFIKAIPNLNKANSPKVF